MTQPLERIELDFHNFREHVEKYLAANEPEQFRIAYNALGRLVARHEKEKNT